VRTVFTLLGFKTWRVNFEICFTSLSKVAMVFNLMKSIILNTLRALDSTSKSGMFLLLAVLVLENTRIYIYISNGSNITFHIEGSINKSFGKWAALKISDIDLVDGYIIFGRNWLHEVWMLLKIWVDFIIVFTTLKLIDVLVSWMK